MFTGVCQYCDGELYEWPDDSRPWARNASDEGKEVRDGYVCWKNPTADHRHVPQTQG